MQTDRPQRDDRAAKYSSFMHAAIEALEIRRMLAAHIVGSPTAYSTIQAAVNAAGAGATITVDAGTYAEQVTISKQLTVEGAEVGIDAAGRVGGSPSSESIVSGAVSSGVHSCAFYVNANDVVIDGFAVQGETNSSDTTGAGIVIAPRISGTHILDNVVQNNVAGLFLANYSSTDAAVIQHNYFGDNNNPGGNSGRGIYTDGGISGGNLTNVTIDSNTFVNNYSSNGVEAACAFQATTAGSQSNIRITNNIMTGNGKAALFFNATGVVITNNTITGSIDQGSGALRFEGNNHNVTIQYNTADNNTAPAVAVDAKGVPGDSSGFVITSNNFFNNNTAHTPPLSVVFDSGAYAGAFDLRNNWWGSASGPGGDGPGAGDAVSAATLKSGTAEGWTLVSGGGELYSPWLGAPYGSAPTLPSAPSGLGAVQAAAGQVNLSWTDTAPGNESGFVVERSADGVNFTQIGTTGAGVTSYVDTANLTVGGTYTYRVAAVNALGNSGYSSAASVTLVANVTTYVSDLPWVSATVGWGTIGINKSIAGNTLSLRGTTYAKGIGTHAVSQIVYNLNGQYTSFLSDAGVDDEENSKGTGSVDFKVLGDGIILFDSGVVTNASAIVHINVNVTGVKQLTLLATNGVSGSIDYDHADWAGARLISAPATPSLPAAPSGATAIASSATAVTVSWTDNAAGNETGFTIERSADGVNFARIAATTTGITSYIDNTSFIPGATYFYRVMAVNAIGNSGYSNVAQVVIPAVGTASRFVLSTLPTTTTAGAGFTFTLNALDAAGNAAAAYTGTVHFTSSDPAASLPADYTFTAADGGSHVFSTTFKTVASQTISVTDVAMPAVTARSSPVAVKAATAVRMIIASPASVSLKSAFNFTITLLDAFGNVATGYLGTVHITSTDKIAILPVDYLFTATDHGVHTFKATFKTRGTQTLTITDKGNTALHVSYSIRVS